VRFPHILQKFSNNKDEFMSLVKDNFTLTENAYVGRSAQGKPWTQTQLKRYIPGPNDVYDNSPERKKADKKAALKLQKYYPQGPQLKQFQPQR